MPKGEKFRALWDGKLKEFEATEDLVVIHKGYLYKLQQEANEAAIK